MAQLHRSHQSPVMRYSMAPALWLSVAGLVAAPPMLPSFA